VSNVQLDLSIKTFINFWELFRSDTFIPILS